MTLAQIKYFLAILEYGGFSAAAEEMYISQSSLSKQIKSLEAELGLNLFVRGNNRVSLSPGGKIFLKYAQIINDSHTRLTRELSYLREQTDAEILSLGTLPLMQDYQISSQLALFQKNLQNAQINISEGDQAWLLKLLLSHKLDMAILRLDCMDLNDFEYHPIRVDEFVLVTCAARLEIFQNKLLSLDILADQPFVMLNPESDIHKLVMDQFDRAGIHPRITLTAGRHLYLLNLVADNLGVTILPKDMVNKKLFPNLVCLPFKESIPTTIGIVRLKDYKHSRLSDLLYEYFSNIGLTPVMNDD